MKKSEDLSELKGLGKILLILVGTFIVMYLITLSANKAGLFDPGYNKPEVSDAVISYENIMAGTIFNREGNYYVAILDSKDKMNTYYESLISNYQKKEDKTPLYVVDLSDELNKSIFGEEDNIKASSLSDMSVKSSTLLLIKNGKIVKYIIDMDTIESELK